MKSRHISWEVTGSTGVLTLGPPPGNLLAEPEFVPLDLLQKWTSAPGLKGIVIHGSGRHFSSGADLERLYTHIRSGKDLAEMMNSGKRVLNHIENLGLPVMAAISGTCFGGGLEIALAANIRICAENALFAFPETGHHLLPGLGGTVRLPHLIRASSAMQMILHGDVVNAEEALSLGLVDRIVPKKELLQYSLSLMGKMTATRPVEVVRAVMTALKNADTLSREDAMKEETRLFCELALREAQRRKTEEE